MTYGGVPPLVDVRRRSQLEFAQGRDTIPITHRFGHGRQIYCRSLAGCWTRYDVLTQPETQSFAEPVAPSRLRARCLHWTRWRPPPLGPSSWRAFVLRSLGAPHTDVAVNPPEFSALPRTVRYRTISALWSAPSYKNAYSLSTGRIASAFPTFNG